MRRPFLELRDEFFALLKASRRAIARLGLGLLPLLTAGCAGMKPPDASLAPDEVLAAAVGGGPGSFPALGVLVIRDGERRLREVRGLRSARADAPASPEDAWHLGSDSKAMTAFLCALAVDRGLLRWDATVGGTLAAWGGDRSTYAAATLEQLLSHSAGLPAGLPASSWKGYFPWHRDPASERERLARDILSTRPIAPPGKRFAYSNLGYVLAAEMLRAADGRAWEEWMRTELFEPLGMRSAGFGPPAPRGDDPKSPSAPWGHAPDPVDPASDFADNPAALGPAGTVHASLDDLEAWLRFWLSGGSAPGGRRILSEASFAELRRPRLGGYALGWGVGEAPGGGRFLQHDGSNTMNYCSILILPESASAVVVVANRGDGDAGLRVAGILRYLAGRFLDL